MKKLIFTITMLLLLTKTVYAKEYNFDYDVCLNGCDYKSLYDVNNSLLNLDTPLPDDTFIINIYIAEGTYIEDNYVSFSLPENVNLNIIGKGINNTTLVLNNGNSNINSYGDYISISNISIKGGLRLDSSNISLKNIDIEAERNDSINIIVDCGSRVPEKIQLDNVNVKKSYKNGTAFYYLIFYGTGHEITIKNSKLLADTSIKYYSYNNKLPSCGCYGWDFSAFDRGTLDHQIYVENSELNKIYAYRAKEDSQIAVLLSDNNKLNLGTNRDDVLVEEQYGKIVLGVNKNINIKISENLDNNIKDIFKDLADNIDWENLDYKIEDETIVKYENGQFIPLKVGETNVIINNQNTRYNLNIVVYDDVVTEDEEKEDIPKEENPNTKTSSIIVSVILMIIGVICFIINYKKLKWLN